MSTATATPTQPTAAELRAKHATLTEERRALEERREELRGMAKAGHGAEIDRLAGLVLQGAAVPAPVAVTAELEKIDHALAVNARALEVLSTSLHVADQREGYAAAAPLFARVMSHVPRLAKALGEVERIMQEADADIAAFMAVHPGIGMAGSQGVVAPYNEAQLGILNRWRRDFISDGINPTRLEAWREFAADLGVPSPKRLAGSR